MYGSSNISNELFFEFEIFFRASYISNGSTFTANLIFECAKRQSAKNMLNLKNQPKRHTIHPRVYAKSATLRVLAYVSPLPAALNRGEQPTQTHKTYAKPSDLRVLAYLSKKIDTPRSTNMCKITRDKEVLTLRAQRTSTKSPETRG